MENRIEGVNPPRKDVAELPEFKSDWWEQAFIAQLPTGVALAPINATEVLPSYIYKQAWNGYALGYASAGGVIMLVILVVLILTHTSLTLPFALWMLTGYFNAIPIELD